MTLRRFNAVSAIDATEGSPTLASLAARARESTRRMQAVEDLIPSELRAAVKAGPEEDGVWCLLVKGNAAAAKLRHMAPLLRTRLQSQGWSTTAIRIKLESQRDG